MVDHVKKYYNDFLTRGKEALASQLFDDDVVHKDLVWVRRDGKGSAWVGWRSAAALPPFPHRTPHKSPGIAWQDPAHPTVGVHGMQHYLHDLRTAFPDFTIEVPTENSRWGAGGASLAVHPGRRPLCAVTRSSLHVGL